jgi:release factor glutamine methyltransferase
MVAPAPAEPALQVIGSELLRWRRELLEGGGDASALDWLLEMQGGLSWQQLQRLQLSPQITVPLRTPLQQLAELWQRHRSNQEPLQYLVGHCPWRDLELRVGPGVLIPRQETELLVELALNLHTLSQGEEEEPQLWADLGTGSGCLGVALARAWPHSHGLAVDLSAAALLQARINLQAQGLLERVGLIQGSWWQPLVDQWGRLDLVVANPPYIPSRVWEQLEPMVREHEPELALNGGEDGLDAIRAIAKDANQALTPGGWLILEHHHDQSTAVMALLRAAGLDHVQAHPDLEGHARFASARRVPA